MSGNGIKLGVSFSGLTRPQPDLLPPGNRSMVNNTPAYIADLPSNVDVATVGPAWTVANVGQLQAQCPTATILYITNGQWATSGIKSGIAHADCDVFDYEAQFSSDGNHNLAVALTDAIAWLQAHQAAHPGRLGCVYMYYGNIPGFITAAQAAGIPGCYIWAAQQTNIEHNYQYPSSYPSGFSQPVTQWSGYLNNQQINYNTIYDQNWLVAYS
jgi:hypothetical protein